MQITCSVTLVTKEAEQGGKMKWGQGVLPTAIAERCMLERSETPVSF